MNASLYQISMSVQDQDATATEHESIDPTSERLNAHNDESTVGDYKYQPLDHKRKQIRLAQLLPYSSFDDCICLRLYIFDLSDAPPYTALSYVWGPPSPVHTVHLEDERSRRGCLRIRDSLYNFLVEIRKQGEKEDSDQYLWIDQLSIDQSTTSERHHQVQMMSEIHSNAESVVVWLRPESTTQLQNSHEAILKHRSPHLSKALAIFSLLFSPSHEASQGTPSIYFEE
jgi:hypothetical protein